MLLGAPAASALAKTTVRFVHAVPGAEKGHLTAGDTKIGGAVGFGESTEAVEVAPGSVDLKLAPTGGGDPLAEGSEELEDGARYTIVALAEGERAELRVYRDGDAEAGKARVRMIHAAPELGEPNVEVGGERVAEMLAYKEATPYVTVEPGRQEVAFTRPDGGDPLAEDMISLSAGTATTAVVAGSRGEDTKVIELSDDTVAPAAAPDTGLGGLADTAGRGPWLAMLIAGLGAGLLAGGSYALAGRRRHGG